MNEKFEEDFIKKKNPAFASQVYRSHEGKRAMLDPRLLRVAILAPTDPRGKEKILSWA